MGNHKTLHSSFFKFLLGCLAILFNLLGAVGARINVRSTYLQQRPTVTWIRTKGYHCCKPSALAVSYPAIDSQHSH